MNSNQTYTQATYRPATYAQVDPSRNYPSPASTNPSPTRPQPNRPPVSIAELADRAKAAIAESSPKGLKHWLRTAENARREGKRYAEDGELENAFVEYAKAATIVLEKLPNHKDYRVLLTSAQRHNMSLHGQEILDSLASVKAEVLANYEDWQARQPSSSAASPNPASQVSTPASVAARRMAQSGSSTPASSASPSSSQNRASFAQHSRTPSPYHQNSQGDDARRVRDEAMRRDEDRRRDAERGRYASPLEESRQDWTRAEQARMERERGSQDDPSRRQQDEGRRRVDDRRRREQEGILRRQAEADAAADAARQPSTYAMPALAMPTANVATAPMSRAGLNAGVIPMPLESPTRPGTESAPKPSRTPLLPPITTTSPPPTSMGSIQYPSLMSQHQILQGYHPSLGSMFHQPGRGTYSQSEGLLFNSTPSNVLYPSNVLPKPSAPASGRGGPSWQSSGPQQQPNAYRQPSPQPPPLPPKELVAPVDPAKDIYSRELKHVNFPRECLHRFLSIAAINTSRNRETCGLLLGKDMGRKFVVTTLLIPKQHSTSDTCTMDEEELVLQFTEERSLITLGWIHTHPTQSCFMSSVDLHTHSGFQCMLPESFAVVCAPKSTPNFGIFRLTDPPGLQTILTCEAKEAFHPHPNVPIYTDADKGHVQIKDISLEIVDLR
ncbi:hypothetical protein FA95DRAFT_1560979 [Auriscalpium vulgare]|uniref:Uncharacterized protein n=1 Tax=Auriscalpium vulgare TaxID=40419 RepID=A0ACB8RNY5_9AGAM|nr:hypothetical protein FA95DRAFT_1560979 [Auriscalpium vulgare]